METVNAAIMLLKLLNHLFTGIVLSEHRETVKLQNQTFFSGIVLSYQRDATTTAWGIKRKPTCIAADGPY